LAERAGFELEMQFQAIKTDRFGPSILYLLVTITDYWEGQESTCSILRLS
jgi:hypothetical protein